MPVSLAHGAWGLGTVSLDCEVRAHLKSIKIKVLESFVSWMLVGSGSRRLGVTFLGRALRQGTVSRVGAELGRLRLGEEGWNVSSGPGGRALVTSLLR